MVIGRFGQVAVLGLEQLDALHTLDGQRGNAGNGQNQLQILLIEPEARSGALEGQQAKRTLTSQNRHGQNRDGGGTARLVKWLGWIGQHEIVQEEADPVMPDLSDYGQIQLKTRIVDRIVRLEDH